MVVPFTGREKGGQGESKTHTLRQRLKKRGEEGWEMREERSYGNVISGADTSFGI